LKVCIVIQTISQEFQNVWPIIALNDFLRYAIAASVLASILFVFRHMLAQRRIQDRHAGWKDIRREVTYSLLTILIFSLVGFGTYMGGLYGIFRLSMEMPTLWSGLFDFVVIVLAHDAYFYWIHRGMHHPRLYRRFHRLHHRSVTPTPWTAYSFAPLEAIVEAAFLPLIFLFLETSHFIAFAFTSHMIVRNVIGHAGVELFPKRWLQWPVLRLITTTTHHDLHHSEFRWNYGLYFTWWDRLMGTEHPHYEERFNASVAREDAYPDGEVGIEPIASLPRP